MITIVGIDPGLAATGVGIVRGSGLKVAGYSFGCITTPSDAPLAGRLDRIYTSLKQLFIREKPGLVVLEDVFSLREYPKSGLSLGQVSGVVMLAASHAGLSCLAVSVRAAKQILTGNGKASKVQLEACVRRHLRHPEPIRPYHAADALGLALIGLLRCTAGQAARPAAAPSRARRRPSSETPSMLRARRARVAKPKPTGR